MIKNVEGNIEWHHDGTYMPIQAKGSVFTAHTVPSSGGETGWVVQASYEALENEMKEKLENLDAPFLEYSQKEGMATNQKKKVNLAVMALTWIQTFKTIGKLHPETGIKCLTIGRHIIDSRYGR